MAIYRTVSMSFWTDSKIVDDFTPEDKYFYLYLFTNPYTNLCGCYEVSVNNIANDTGYNRESVRRLLDRFEKVHNVIRYSSSTKEILLLNWHKYNWTKSEKFRKPLLKEIEGIKEKSFMEYLSRIANGEKIRYGIDTNCIDTTVTVTVTDTVTDTVSDSVSDADMDTASDDVMTEDDFFEMVWSIYPKKRGKSGVSKKSKKKLIKIGYDHIARAIDRYTREMSGKDIQYMMYGSTFFNGGYLDYLDDNYKPLPTREEQMADPFMKFMQKPDEGGLLGI